MSKTELKGEDRYFGLNSRVWEASLGKILIALASGRSNLGGWLFYADNLDFVKDIPELVNEISSRFTFFDSASRKCSLESMSRPVELREEEVAVMLGYQCPSCGRRVSTLGYRYQKTCGCNAHSQLGLRYLSVYRELRALNVEPTPEAVLMSVAWDTLAEAYVKAYTSLKRVIDTLVDHYGYSCAMDFVRPALKDQLDAIFYYYEPGDVRMCLLPDSPVITSDGVKCIADVKVGDKVLTHKGRFRRVLRTWSREYSGNIAEIMSYYDNQPAKMTLNHVLPVGLRGNYREINWTWMNAGKLEETFRNGPKRFRQGVGKPFIVYPIIQGNTTPKHLSKHFDVDSKLFKCGRFDLSLLDGLRLDRDETKVWTHFGRTKTIHKINRFIKITPDFLRLCGYYLSEGNCGEKTCFAFSEDETEFISDVKQLMLQVFGVECHTAKHKVSHSIQLVIGSRIIDAFFKDLFGQYAHGKKIPEWVFYLPRDYQKELLIGYIRGDGCGANGQSGIRCRTISISLAYQIKMLLAKFRVLASVLKENPEVTKNRTLRGHSYNFHDIYELHINGYDNVQMISEMVGFENRYRVPTLKRRVGIYRCKSLNIRNGVGNFNNYFIPIKSINITQYSGLVYDLTVEEDETYCLHNMIVHNSKEERENLMLLVRGVLAEIGVAEMERVLRAAMKVCKFGYLANKLFCAGADYQYELAREEFSALYNPLNTKIRHSLIITRGERETKLEIDVLRLKTPEYYPAALMPKDAWSTGTLARQISLVPLVKGDLPIFSDDENVAMNCLVSGSGGGKTTFMGANIDHAINWAGEYVLSILGDEKNGLSLSNLPLFPCEGRTGVLLKILDAMGVSPQPIPCVNVAYYRNSKDLESNFERQDNMLPPTIFCRKVLIDDPSSFGLEFKTPKRGEIVETKDVIGNRGLLNVLEEFALALGYKRVCGLINTLNPLRKESDLGSKSQSKPDILIGIELLYKFLAFRQENKTPSARVYIDELSRFAPTTHAVAGTDTSKAAATFGESIKAMRGMNTSVDCATQKWNEINIEAKSEAFNIFFRNLSKQSDKSHSQRDLVLGSMDLEDEESDKALVNKLASNKKDFPPDAHLWFHYNKLRGRIDIIRPNPPRFMLNQPKKTNRQVYKAYENYMEVLRDSSKIEDRIRFKQLSEANKKLGSEDGIHVLLKSWRDVPTLQYENTEYSSDNYKRGAA